MPLTTVLYLLPRPPPNAPQPADPKEEEADHASIALPELHSLFLHASSVTVLLTLADENGPERLGGGRETQLNTFLPVDRLCIPVGGETTVAPASAQVSPCF